MKMLVKISDTMAAPCGMNCSLCIAFQRSKNNCSGCNSSQGNKLNHCAVCSIRNCEELLKQKTGFCFSCKNFPCRRLKQLDIRYSTKYKLSTIQNLLTIEIHGIRKFLQMEAVKWTCKKCGSLLCVHKGNCLNCEGHKS
ncbi:MAG: DUF3795 domain-containing protein [Methanococcaceae archaeon]